MQHLLVINYKIFEIFFNYVLNQIIWRPSRKTGLTHKTTETRIVRYAMIQSPQWFSELTHSSSEASTSDYLARKHT